MNTVLFAVGTKMCKLRILTIAFPLLTTIAYSGLGRDMWTVPFEDITTTLLVQTSTSPQSPPPNTPLQYFWVSEIVYFSTLGFIKIAFLLFYLKIFPDKSFRRIVWTVIVFSLASTIAFAITATLVCAPVSFAWKQWDGENGGKCLNNNTLAFTHAAFSIFLDFVTLSLPITQIWNLHLALKKKIGVLLMFSVGAL
jgi:hypothetical protein